MAQDEAQYKGAERRSGPRRKTSDRRDDIRFEPAKENRRKKPGRRQSDRDGDLWKFNP